MIVQTYKTTVNYYLGVSGVCVCARVLFVYVCVLFIFTCMLIGCYVHSMCMHVDIDIVQVLKILQLA